MRKPSHRLQITLGAALSWFSVEATFAPAAAQLRTDIPTLMEIDRLDPVGSRIERFAFTARGAMTREMPIPDSANRFCTLEHEHNVVLNYYPERDQWVFQVQSNDSAQFAAGGIATCLDLTQVPIGSAP